MTTALDRAQKLTEIESIQDRTVGRPAARERLAELVADEDDDVRAAAAEAIGIYPEDAALVQAALRLAAEDGATAVRRAAVTSLGRVLEEGVLAGAEEDGYAPEQELGEPPADTYAAVKALLSDMLAEEPLEDAALLALSPLSTDWRVVDRIEKRLETDPRLALRCVGRGGDPRWHAAVQEALEHDDEAVVLAAIEAAGRVEATGALPLLTRILKSAARPAPQRAAAATALGALGGQNTATPLLEVAEHETDEEVQSAARMALADLALLEQATRRDDR